MILELDDKSEIFNIPKEDKNFFNNKFLLDHPYSILRIYPMKDLNLWNSLEITVKFRLESYIEYIIRGMETLHIQPEASNTIKLIKKIKGIK